MRRSSARASVAFRSSLAWLFVRSSGGCEGEFEFELVPIVGVAGVIVVVGDSVMCERCFGFVDVSRVGGWEWGCCWWVCGGGGVPVLAARPKRGMAFEKFEVKRFPRLRGFMELMKFEAVARGSLLLLLLSVGALLLLMDAGWVLRLRLLVVLLALSTLRSRLGPLPARSSRVLLLLLVVDFGLVTSLRGSSGDERPDPERFKVSSSVGGGVETSLRASSRVLGKVTAVEPGVTWSFNRPKRELRLFSSVPLMLS
jgi:hypothetical protein